VTREEAMAFLTATAERWRKEARTFGDAEDRREMRAWATAAERLAYDLGVEWARRASP
jgi:hypothetical protein